MKETRKIEFEYDILGLWELYVMDSFVKVMNVSQCQFWCNL